MDSQQRELMGRHRLIESLLRGGLEVAAPLRDRGVDLVAYEPPGSPGGFDAFPIQLKSFSGEGFSIHKKYAGVDRLVLAYVWHMHEPAQTSILALTYAEALSVAEDMGYTRTESWRAERGEYHVTKPGAGLRERLARYRIQEDCWTEPRDSSALRIDRLDAELLGTSGPSPTILTYLERRGVPVNGPGDWLAWRELAERTWLDRSRPPERETVKRCLVVHVRQDRTVEGHWAEMVASGEIQRLMALLDQPVEA